MNNDDRALLGLNKQPFAADPSVDKILQTQALIGVKKRFDYTLCLGGIALVTGEIGAGKSTALCYAAGEKIPFIL